MHSEAHNYVQRILNGLPMRQAVVEFGSRDINGGIKDIFPKDIPYIGIDLYEDPGVDVVASAADYTPPFVPDTVVCCEVLEHTPLGPAIITNAYRILGPGGVLILTAAAPPREPHSGKDGFKVLQDGEHYANIDKAQLEGWFASAGFTHVVEYHEDRCDIYAVGYK